MHTHLFLKCIQLFCSSESHAATRRALCYPFQCSDHVSTTEKHAPALAPYGFCLLIAAADIPSPKAGHFQSLDWVEGWFSSNTRAPLTAALHTCDSVWHGCLGIHLWVVPAASPPCSPPACMPWGGGRGVGSRGSLDTAIAKTWVSYQLCCSRRSKTQHRLLRRKTPSQPDSIQCHTWT